MSASVSDWKYLNPSKGINWPAPDVAPMDDTCDCCPTCGHDWAPDQAWSFVWAPPTHR